MTERVKDAPELAGDFNGRVINNPLIIIDVQPDGTHQLMIFPEAIDRMMSQPGMFGIAISDLIDHIARAYHDAAGKDERLTRETILRTMKNEDRFKQQDPTRGQLRGATIIRKDS